MRYLFILIASFSFTLSAQIINDFGDTGGFILPHGDSSVSSLQMKGNLIFQESDSTLLYFDGKRWHQVLANHGKGSNLFIGSFVAKNKVTGTSNSGVGYRVFEEDSASSNNSAFGAFALQKSTTSYDNVAVGYKALKETKYGSGNVAVGASSLLPNKTGYWNVAVGANSLSSNISGQSNLAIGFSSLSSNTIGEDNIGVGYFSGWKNISGNKNIAIGIESLSTDTSGNSNISIGYRAMKNAKTVSRNIAIGMQAGENSENSSKNVFIGEQAGCHTSGNGNIFVGFNAGLNSMGDNKLFIHNNSSSTPLIYGEFDQKIIKHNGSTIHNGSTLFNPDSTNVDIEITYKILGANKEPFIRPTSPNWGFLGDETNYFYSIYSRNFYAFESSSYQTWSDRRLKERINDLPSVWTKLNQLRPVTYFLKKSPEFKSKNNPVEKKLQYGFIAQELEKVFPEFVMESESGMKSVSYQALIPILVKAIQEQNAKIKALEDSFMNKE